MPHNTMMQNTKLQIKTNGLKAWLLASRPKTLTGAAAPVLLGGAMAWKVNGGEDFLVPFLLCLLFAFLMQIDANLVNDYYDFKKGTDREDRLGPERACAQGWITPGAMLAGIGLCTLLSCGIGLGILFYNVQWELILVGVACVLGCFLYTLKLSYLGLGDLLVLIFFGIVPVVFTYYVITNGECSMPVALLGIGMGMITDNLLIVNNYRDVEQDKMSGKNTIVVRFGKRFAENLYFINGFVAALILAYCSMNVWGGMAVMVFVVMATFYLRKQMCSLTGKALNGILGKTALLIFLYGFVGAVLILIS